MRLFIDTADLSVYSDAAEEDMRQISKLYDRFRFNLAIGHLGILNQKPGTHEEWRLSRIQKGTAPTQVKPVRILDSPEKEEFFMSRIIEQ